MEWVEWLWQHFGMVVVVAVWMISAMIGMIKGKPGDPFDALRYKLSKPVLDALEGLFKRVEEEVKGRGDGQSEEMRGVVVRIMGKVVSKACEGANRLDGHVRRVFGVIASEKMGSLVMGRTFGAVISLFLFGLFVYADLVQSVNNFSLLYPEEVARLPDWLKNIAFSLMMSSAGTALTLGFIMADARGLTDFLPWEGVSWKKKEEDREERTFSVRRRVFWTAMGTFVFTLLLLVLMALPRTVGVAEVRFMEGFEDLVFQLAAVAHVLIILPMLITTALLFWGMAGLIVVYGAGVGLLLFFWRVVEWALSFVKDMVKAFESESKLFSYLVRIVIATVFVVLGLLLGTILTLLEALTRAVESIVIVVFYPFVLLGGLVKWVGGKKIG